MGLLVLHQLSQEQFFDARDLGQRNQALQRFSQQQVLLAREPVLLMQTLFPAVQQAGFRLAAAVRKRPEFLQTLRWF